MLLGCHATTPPNPSHSAAGKLEVAMVSLRRRRLLGLSHGASCSSVLPTEYQNTNDTEKTEKTGKSVDEQAVIPVNIHHMPSATLNLAFEQVKQEKEIMENPPTKKQKIHVQIDPENPLEVHAYLMQLKEENKLEPDPMQPNGEVPAKEWMEERYPYIFRVFPQNPKVLVQFDNKSMQNDFLYCHYWLFLFELRNIALMDYHTSPEYVISLGKVIDNLENQGFDCRFMRSELIVVGCMIKQQLEILLAEKNVIASRTMNLKKKLQTAKGNETELDGETQITEITIEADRQPKESDNLQETDKTEGEIYDAFSVALQKECMEAILERCKKMLLCKEEESKRLNEVLEEISRLHRHKAAFPGLVNPSPAI